MGISRTLIQSPNIRDACINGSAAQRFPYALELFENISQILAGTEVLKLPVPATQVSNPALINELADLHNVVFIGPRIAQHRAAPLLVGNGLAVGQIRGDR